MEEADVAIRLEESVWMDRDGNVVDEKTSFGCKVTHRITRPEMVICFDELGGNTSQKGDGHVGGQLLLCETGKTPQVKISTRDKHYTIMGLATLTGEPVMCVVIFAGTKPNPLCKTGLDLSAETFGSPDDHDYFKKNSGPGKRFPGGPTCKYLGKEVPCFCAWSEKGGVIAEILMRMLGTLEKLQVFSHKDAIPFLVCDAHGSRFKLAFLEYINNPRHKWAVCIGVPYGTALWQVGDSSEQNGAMNVASVVEKGKL